MDGLDQGEVNASILWRIFYDSLLCLIKICHASNGYSITAKWTSSILQNQHSKSLSLNNLAFVDDTVWIAKNHQSMQQILNTVSQFYKICDIEINPKKTKTIYFKTTDLPPNTNLYIGSHNNQIQILSPNTCTKYLGLFINANGTFTTQLNKIRADTTFLSNLINRKKIIDKQAIYIINCVFIPAFEYQSQLFIISKTECERLM